MLADEDGAGAKLWAMAHLATPMVLRVAATLRIADHIAAGLRTAPELAEAVNADADALDRLMRYLAARDVLSRDESGRYALTARGEALRDDHPAGMRALLDVDGAVGRIELSFVQLLHSVRTGEAAYPVQFGRPFWEDLAADPARADSFNGWMSANVPARAPGLLSCYDWGSLGHVVDVGGGDGSLLIALLTEYPELRGTVLDQPDTAEVARKSLAAAGLADRADIVAGSFFDPLPPGAGGYVLSWIIHDWNDTAARAILRRCAEAAGPDGTVFVLETIDAGGGAPHTGMDLRMLVHCGGKERGVAEITALAAGSGLKAVAVYPAGKLSIIELKPVS
ncbi:methyltransferase [Streptosporangium roseum]|uniref:Hydroxyneurosporene-O-methyltransferase n=1 Tax=Streptosporangium roseum (strain ATCC 12428 / DSM 43021 / JCM 3005 / KCTC 9067 / NCIMB 10171 / NRRL 2505 / NI 9100) TaxID=479432 RepID=D2B7D8_STRRD|nr:methyltransferase [Streptosporangium roseum]ACZ89663.1 hydroxyneurosporene-O-methyltransferase [Streptosporangium roseum DSM 43021]